MRNDPLVIHHCVRDDVASSFAQLHNHKIAQTKLGFVNVIGTDDVHDIEHSDRYTNSLDRFITEMTHYAIRYVPNVPKGVKQGVLSKFIPSTKDVLSILNEVGAIKSRGRHTVKIGYPIIDYHGISQFCNHEDEDESKRLLDEDEDESKRRLLEEPYGDDD